MRIPIPSGVYSVNKDSTRYHLRSVLRGTFLFEYSDILEYYYSGTLHDILNTPNQVNSLVTLMLIGIMIAMTRSLSQVICSKLEVRQ